MTNQFQSWPQNGTRTYITFQVDFDHVPMWRDQTEALVPGRSTAWSKGSTRSWWTSWWWLSKAAI